VSAWQVPHRFEFSGSECLQLGTNPDLAPIGVKIGRARRRKLAQIFAKFSPPKAAAGSGLLTGVICSAFFRENFCQLLAKKSVTDEGAAHRQVEGGVVQLFFAKKLPKNRTRILTEIQRSAAASPPPKSRSKNGEEFQKCPAGKGPIPPDFHGKNRPAPPGELIARFISRILHLFDGGGNDTPRKRIAHSSIKILRAFSGVSARASE